MGLITRMLAPEQRKAAWDDYWYTPVGGVATNAGVRVDTDQAMRCAAVFACVRILSESIGSVPCKLYRQLPEGGKEVARDHPMHRLVHQEPSPQMTPLTFFETVMAHLATRGNAYCVMERDRLGRQVKSLEMLSPMSVEAKLRKDGDLEYHVKAENGKTEVYQRDQMLHIPAFAWDGLRGLAPIEYMRESVGLALAAEEFGARYFSQGTHTGAVVTVPDGVTRDQEQATKFREDLDRAHQGLGKSHRAIVLPFGTTYQPISIAMNDAQFLETRRFQKADIASIFRVPLHLIQEHEKSTSWGTGIYQMTLGFVQYTLRPWAVRIEQALNQQLLSEAEREVYFFEFNLDALLRGDLDAQAQWFAQAIQYGIMSRNEVREILNRNPVEGGDVYLTPLNLGVPGAGPVPMAPSAQPAPPAGDAEPQRAACDCGHEHRVPGSPKDAEKRTNRPSIQRSYIRVIRDAMERVMRRERNDIIQGAGKVLRNRGVGDLERFIDEFYAGHQEFTREQITPAFTALAEAVGSAAMREVNQTWEWSPELQEWLAAYIRAFAERHSLRSRQQLLDLIAATVAEDGDVLEALSVRFDEWESGVADSAATRAEKIAAENATRLGEGFSREAFFAAGVVSLVWVATGSDTCPYCQGLDGRVVGREGSFLSAGEAFAPGGAEPLVPSTNVMHPPAHAGCDCLIIPGV